MEKSRTLAPFQTNMKFDFLVHQKKNVINEFVPNERKKMAAVHSSEFIIV